MAVVHHDKRMVFVRQIADAAEICDDTVHRENAVRRDKLDAGAVFIGLDELLFQIRHVVVVIAVTRRLAEPYAVDDARVIELIGNDRVLRRQNRLKKAAVRVEAGGIQNRILRAEKCADLLFKLLVNVERAADKAHGRAAESAVFITFTRRVDQFLGIRQPEIVVGAHVDHLFAVGGGDLCALRGGDDALALKKTVRLDFFHFVVIKFECFGLIHTFLRSAG